MQRFSIILRILSSKSVSVNYTEFKKYCNETYLKLISYFSWVHVPGSIHRLLSHGVERIHINSDYGLGNLSEEGLESCNKMVRRFQDLGARKMSLKESLTDVYTHWWVQSDGIIQDCARTNQCQNCWQIGTSNNSRRDNLGQFQHIDLIGNDDEWIFKVCYLLSEWVFQKSYVKES